MENITAVLVLLNDLMFQVKIAEAAKPLGIETKFVKSAVRLLQLAEQDQPALIIVDINFAEADPIELIRKLKADAGTKAIPLLGYVAHVQVELRAAAAAAGCDVVLARSAFIQNLQEILMRSSAAAASSPEGRA